MTQNELVLEHLKKYPSITPLEALTRYGVMRLAARIKELRNEGVDITTETRKHDGRRYAAYKLGAAYE